MLPGGKQLLAKRLLWIVAFFIVTVVISYWLYKAIHEPSPGSASSAANVIGGSGPAPSMRRSVQSHAEGAQQQAPDTGRHSDTRVPQVEDGRTIETCHWTLLKKKYVEKRNCDNIPADDVAKLQFCRNELDKDFSYLEQLAAKAAACPESLVNASDYYIALRDAALTGDVNAQKCFLAGYFNNRDAGEGIGETQLKEYLSLARQFIQSAFERGDWALVHRLAGSYVDDPGLLILVYPYGTGHLDTMYKMNYLLTLGSGDGAGSVEAGNIVNAIRNNGGSSAEQIQATEEWARETYDRYFAATPYDEKAAASSFCQTDLN